MRRFSFLFIGLCSLIALSAKNVSLTPYVADSANNTRIAVIVCPGGSYSWLAINTEGHDVARWLQSNGINAYVLKYRVVTVPAYVFGIRVLGLGHKYPDMLEDVEWALKEVYNRAAADGVDTARIGVMGFSAGGHLTMLSYAHNHTLYKPHFLCPIYPVVTMADLTLAHPRSRRAAMGGWRMANKALRDSLSMEKQIRDDCPPVFLLNCRDDRTVKYQNSVLLDSALIAHNIPHRYILYDTGGHGFGASDTKGSPESRQWKNEFLHWIATLFNVK